VTQSLKVEEGLKVYQIDLNSQVSYSFDKRIVNYITLFTSPLMGEGWGEGGRS
jgi:glutamine cyclotransferase